MNELTWLTSNDPVALLAELYPMRGLHSTQPQGRKCRLYLLACARRQWDRLPEVCRMLVELAERYADSPREEESLRMAVAPVAEQLMHSVGEPDDLLAAFAALVQADAVCPRGTVATLEALESPLKPDEWRGLSALVYLPFELRTPPFTFVPGALHSIDLLREVFGNPCRHIPFDPDWRTDTAMSLARQMYESRDFSAMPILADALQDAGCDNDDVLNHCRALRDHVRGCWVVDLVLPRR